MRKTLLSLDKNSVVRAYTLETYPDGLALILEDYGDLPLKDLIRPEPLGQIILKLLAKNAGERYQTAAGLLVDLTLVKTGGGLRGQSPPLNWRGKISLLAFNSRSNCTAARPK